VGLFYQTLGAMPTKIKAEDPAFIKSLVLCKPLPDCQRGGSRFFRGGCAPYSRKKRGTGSPVPLCPSGTPCRDKLLRDPSGEGGESSEIWGFAAFRAAKPQVSLSFH
jgi:hypothetical protein